MYLQDGGILLEEVSKVNCVSREQVDSAGGQVSVVPSLSANVAPSEGHNRVLPIVYKNDNQLWVKKQGDGITCTLLYIYK